MPQKILAKRFRLRLVVLNDSVPVLKMLCKSLTERGHTATRRYLPKRPKPKMTLDGSFRSTGQPL